MNVFENEGNIVTENLTPGLRVYGEKLVEDGGVEYRVWNPYRSKLAAALLNGLNEFDLGSNSKILYLGASTGTTVSHVSDIVCDGLVYAVEFSPVNMRKLNALSLKRSNIIPLLNDATKPKEYLSFVEKVDLVYCDVAQPNQSELFMDNMNLMLKDDGKGLITIKARSIDVVQKPKKIFKEEEKKLKASGFSIIQKVKLEPYEKDHVCFYVEKSF